MAPVSQLTNWQTSVHTVLHALSTETNRSVRF